MSLAATLASDIPAAPSPGQRRAMVHQRRAAAQVHHAIFIRRERTQQMSRHAQALRGGVTFETVVIADEPRPCVRLLAERVKHRPQLRIDRGKFEQRRAGDEPDVDIVVEKERAWRAWGYTLALKRRLGEHQHL